MRRLLLTCLLIPLVFPAGASAAKAKLVACVPATSAQLRSATFEARARRMRGSERIQVSFTLQVRDTTQPGWHRVVAAGLDEWLTSDSGVRRYLYAKTVQNLSAPAAYRTVVRFRWLDSRGAVRARSRATSRVCHQPDLRPNLIATQIDVVAPLLVSEQVHYSVTLHNSGLTASGPFSVALRAGEHELAPLALLGLAPGERRVITFIGPLCAAGGPLTVTVDANLAVDERDEDDNVLVAPCPVS